MTENFRQKLTQSFKQSFGAGLLFLIPVMLTFWVFTTLLGWVDSAMLFFPRWVGIEEWFLFKIPGIGIIFAVLIIGGCGFLVRNYMGNVAVLIWDRTIRRVPYVGPVYSGIKQLVQTMLSGGARRRFGRVVLFEYPRKGIWSMGFVTNESSSREIAARFDQPMIHVFVPTAPNPTSGFILVVPKSDVIDIQMRVDDAFKFIISGGIVRTGEDFEQAIARTVSPAPTPTLKS